jgi:hypothetical protein
MGIDDKTNKYSLKALFSSKRGKISSQLVHFGQAQHFTT